MRYKDYDIDDFLMDEFFIQWIKNPNENNRHFWEKWLEQHPEKREVVMEAISIIGSVHYKEKSTVDNRLYIETFENIVKAEKHPVDNKSRSFKKQKRHFDFPFRQIAATLLILFCFGMMYHVVFHPPIKEVAIKNEIKTIKRANPAGK
ncbi:MAG: anti-sigma factor, partial [Anditalea sp.]